MSKSAKELNSPERQNDNPPNQAAVIHPQKSEMENSTRKLSLKNKKFVFFLKMEG